jgi:hypothetical protein
MRYICAPPLDLVGTPQSGCTVFGLIGSLVLLSMAFMAGRTRMSMPPPLAHRALG